MNIAKRIMGESIAFDDYYLASRRNPFFRLFRRKNA